MLVHERWSFVGCWGLRFQEESTSHGDGDAEMLIRSYDHRGRIHHGGSFLDTVEHVRESAAL